MPEPRSIYIFLNGDLRLPSVFPKGHRGGLVFAVDRGAEHALSLGWPVGVLLGDFDSIDPLVLERIRAGGATEILTFPVEKDKTDFELALELALERIAAGGVIYVLAAFGGPRLDMSFSSLFLPAAAFPRAPEKKARIVYLHGESLIYAFAGPDKLTLPFDKTGSLVSLIPLCPEARGVTLEGEFKYPLRRGKIPFGSTLGLSNEYRGGAGAVILEEGVLAVIIQPLPQPQLSDPDPDAVSPPENFPDPF
jgi:thiamine pyrophosphokinase